MQDTVNQSRQEIIARLIEELQSPNEADRRYAAEDIEDGGYAEAVPQLVECLKDPSIAVAEAAASALGRIGNQEAARLLVKNLASENVRLRNLSNEVLSKLGSLAVEALKEELASEDRDVRKFAVDALLDINSTESLDALLVACEDEDVNIGATAIDGIGQLGDQSHVPLIAKYLESEAWMKAAVLRAMGMLGGEVAFSHIAPCLKDKDIVVQITAIQSLGSLKDPRGFEALLAALASPVMPNFAGEFAQAMHEVTKANPEVDYRALGTEENLKLLGNLYKACPAPQKLLAVELFGRFGESAVRPLVELCCSVDEELRKEVADTLVKIRPSRIEPFLEIIGNENTSLPDRSAALDVILRVGHPKAEEVLLKELDCKSPVRIMAALESAHYHCGGEIEQRLKRLLLTDNAMLRIGVAEAMGKCGQRSFIKPLVAQLGLESNEEVKEAVERALENIGETTEDAEMAPYLENFAPHERMRAMAYFGYHDPKENADPYLEGMNDDNPEIRMLSYKVLANLGRLDFVRIYQGIQDPVDYVRVEAVRSLSFCKEAQEVLDFARRIIEENPEGRQRVKVELIQVLVSLAMPDVPELLLKLLADPSPWVQLEAVEALADLRIKRALEPIRQLLDSSHPELREAVTNALKELE